MKRSIIEQIEETKKQSEEVAKIWQQLYDRQRENVLEWPSALSQQFRDNVEKLKFGDPITPPSLLGDYQNYAERYYPELPKIVGARPLREDEMGSAGGFGSYGRGGGEGGYGRGGGEQTLNANGLPDELDDSYICEWLDQAWVRDQLRFQTRPTSIRVWVTQEDLWVLRTLLTVIRNTNEAAGATRKSNAAVKTIYSLEVGKRAAPYSRNPGHVYRPPTAAPAADAMLGGEGGGEAAAMGMEGAGRYGGTSEYSMEGRGGLEMGLGGEGGRGYGGADGPMTEEQERAILTGGRYLGPDGKPLGGGADMAMAADPSADPAAAAPAAPTDFGVEYKRLPVRMSLQMDQRWLTHLITECANQPLQVEVQEVRINPSDFAGASGGGGIWRRRIRAWWRRRIRRRSGRELVPRTHRHPDLSSTAQPCERCGSRHHLYFQPTESVGIASRRRNASGDDAMMQVRLLSLTSQPAMSG